jgi:hypothetical protein
VGFLTPWDTFERRRIGAPGESERARKEKQKSRIIHFDMNDMMETCFSSSGSAGCSRLRKQGCNASRITTGNTSRCLMVLLFLSVRYAPAYYTHKKPSNFFLFLLYS